MTCERYQRILIFMILQMTIQSQLHPKKRDTLFETLKNESESPVNWFRNNNIIVNPEKSQLMLLQKSTKKVIQEKLQIDNNEIKSENLVTLLGITIDNQLSFDDHISKLCNKASMQLNAIFRLKKHMSKKNWKLFLTVLYIPISITVPLCGTLRLINLLKKLKTYISVVLD